MHNIKPQDLKVGSLFYECQSGMNIEAVCVTDPVKSEGLDGRDHHEWEARNTQSGSLGSYSSTAGLEHYGPRLYASPQYISIKEGGIVDGVIQAGGAGFPLMGGDMLCDDLPDPLGLRDPRHLAAWAASLGETGPGVGMKLWMQAAHQMILTEGMSADDFATELEARADEVTRAFQLLLDPKECEDAPDFGI